MTACEVTVIEKATTAYGVVNKSCRSVAWRYFNKLPGKEGSRFMLCGHVLKDCGKTTNLFKVNTSFVLEKLFMVFVLLY